MCKNSPTAGRKWPWFLVSKDLFLEGSIIGTVGMSYYNDHNFPMAIMCKAYPALPYSEKVSAAQYTNSVSSFKHPKEILFF